MQYELLTPDLKPLPPYQTLRVLSDWLHVFGKEGVNLYQYVFEPEGDWGWSEDFLAEQGHSEKEISMILQTSQDEFHDASSLLIDLTRCEEVLARLDEDKVEHILKEIHAMKSGCNVAIEKGLPLQILALDSDEEDEMDSDE